MKVRGTLHASVAASELLKRIPPRFTKCVDVSLVAGTIVDLLLFTPGDRYVVSSKDLLKAMERRPASAAQLVAVAYDFTEEARDLIASIGGLMFAEAGYFGWTDESWHSVNQ